MNLEKFKARSMGELPARSLVSGKPLRRRTRRVQRVAPMDLQAYLPSIRPPEPRRGNRQAASSANSSVSQDSHRHRTDGDLPGFEGKSPSQGSFQGKPFCPPIQRRILALAQHGAHPNTSAAGSSKDNMQPNTEGDVPPSKLDHSKLLHLEADLDSSEEEDQLSSSEDEDSKQTEADNNSEFKTREPQRSHRMIPAEYAEVLHDGSEILCSSKQRAVSLHMPRPSRVCSMVLSGSKPSCSASEDLHMQISTPKDGPSQGRPLRPRCYDRRLSRGVQDEHPRSCDISRPQGGGTVPAAASKGNVGPPSDGDITMDPSVHLAADHDSSEEVNEGEQSNTDPEGGGGFQNLRKSHRLMPVDYASVQLDSVELHAIQEALYSSQQSSDEQSDRAPPVSRAYPMDFANLEIRQPEECPQKEFPCPQSRGRYKN